MLIPLLSFVPALPAEDPARIVFETHQLSEEFFGEGASFGDFDGDGVSDVAAGPFWYRGPEFTEKERIYDGGAFDPAGYSDYFFSWARDIDGDGATDLFVVGFPGKEAFWYRNPGEGVGDWSRHLVHDNVDNESPWFVDIDADGLEDLVCHSKGRLCWLERDSSDPAARWIRHDLSEDLGLQKFTHGLGVGDVDGDGRLDVLLNQGWWRQPESLDGDPLWSHQPVRFSPGYGGAQILVDDLDGDGDGDVISSHAAHGYGLSWWEQVAGADGEAEFVQHPIMGLKPGEHGCPLAVSELHALDHADVDGDGLLDIISGKRFWSHGTSEPGATDPAELFWLRQVRDASGTRFVAHRIHGHSGVGVQVMAGDIDLDGMPDVVVGNKMGVFVHLQRRLDEPVADGRSRIPDVELQAYDPFPGGWVRPRGASGGFLNLNFEDGTLGDWTAEGDAFEGQPVQGDTVSARRGDMTSDHVGEYWIGGYELHEDGRTGSLTSAPFALEHPYVSFLVAGGASADTRVDILSVQSGRRLASVAGRNHEALRPVVVDLSGHVGERVRVRLVDDATGGWGHLNFDDLRLYAERPQFADGLEVDGSVDVRDNAGLLPEEAAAAMDVPEGFHVDLIAGEPDLYQPIAFTIDERGRLWVAEAHAYPMKRAPEDARDKLVIFEDADGDGVFESRSVFADGLNLVSGFEVGFGGVFVGAAPELLFIPDADKNDVPDGPAEVLLDGWGYQDTHETLNAFIWGPDGWLYGCHGVFTHSNVGAPGTADEDRVRINAGVWRFHPKTREFEVFAEGSSNPWGVDFDDHGRAFITACVIPHLYQLTQGGRYVRQAGNHFNPHIYEDIATAADHLHYLGDTPWSGIGRSDTVGGGHAHCGAMIYLGDSFPDRYRNTLFMNNIHGNRVNNEILEPHRSGYVARHADDFLLANDQWFRGINLRYGPRGEVYLIDWYDKQACHYVSDEVWNRTNGRLYRVSYGDVAEGTVDLGSLNESQLVELALHPNDWYVRTARRLLQERGLSGEGCGRLVEIARKHPDDTRRLRGLWALHVTGSLSAEDLALALTDESPAVRAWAIQLSCESGNPPDRHLETMEELARTDPSPVVRLYLAAALQRLPLANRWEIARGLASHAEDADDPNIPFLLWYGVEPLVPESPARAIALMRTSEIPKLSSWIARRAASEDSTREELIGALAVIREDEERRIILDAMEEALGRRRGLAMPAAWPRAYRNLAESEEDWVRDSALVLAAMFGDDQAYPALRSRLGDAEAPVEDRELALDALVRGRDSEAVPELCDLLGDPELRGPALKALASFDDPSIPGAILAAYPDLSEAQRRDAVSTLTSRAGAALALFDAIESEAVDRSVLTAFELRKLRDMGEPKVTQRLTEVWGVVRDVQPDAEATIEAWKQRLSEEVLAAADLHTGRDVFARTCQRCHTLYGEGMEIGPDLTGSNRPDLDYLLQNMVDPNAIIPKEYQVTILRTTDGRIVTGIVEEETDDAVTVQTENELVTLAAEEIEARRDDPNSMMPVGQLETLAEEEVAALVAYLRHDAQVPRRMVAGNESAFFDGATLTGWRGDPDVWSVEDGVIVGKTEGLDRNSFLRSDFEMGDFRLLLEVRLTPNGENGGIQFRSRELDGGDVEGYQADVGAGWWGKLYEEHGRAVLAGDQRDEHVKAEDWNTYEILAVGDRIQTAINGAPCVDLVDPDGARRGIVAFQVHSGGAVEIRYRILGLELDPAPDLSTVSR